MKDVRIQDILDRLEKLERQNRISYNEAMSRLEGLESKLNTTAVEAEEKLEVISEQTYDVYVGERCVCEDEVGLELKVIKWTFEPNEEGGQTATSEEVVSLDLG